MVHGLDQPSKLACPASCQVDPEDVPFSYVQKEFLVDGEAFEEVRLIEMRVDKAVADWTHFLTIWLL